MLHQSTTEATENLGKTKEKRQKRWSYGSCDSLTHNLKVVGSNPTPATTYSVQLHTPSYCRVLNKSYPRNHSWMPKTRLWTTFKKQLGRVMVADKS